LNLKLAIIDSCAEDGCQVKMVSDGRDLYARYSAMSKGRVIMHPAQLVAVDFDAAPPELAWRWHRVQVAELTPTGAITDDRGVQQIPADLPSGFEMNLQVGDWVYITGFGKTYEIHAQISDGQVAHPERIEQHILPRVVAQLAAFAAQRGS
jgi:hypothetical protein